MINQDETRRISDKFFKDGDWVLVERLIEDYLLPLRDVSTIDIKDRSADSVMAEVAGRKIAYDQLTKFLRDCRILSRITNNQNISFK